MGSSRKLGFFAFIMVFALLRPVYAQTCAGVLAEPTASSVLARLAATVGPHVRVNPKLLSPQNLRVGDTLWVTPDVFQAYRMLASKIKTSLHMRVVKIAAGDMWRKGQSIVYLENPETGVVAIEAERLGGHIFSSSDFAVATPFEPGEYVEIGGDDAKGGVYRQLAEPHDKMVFVGDGAKYVGRFVRVYDEKNYLIDVQADNLNVEIIVPRTDVYGLTGGSGLHVTQNLEELLSLKLAFSAGETVRFRGADGRMGVGEYLQTQGDQVTIKDHSGAIHKVPAVSVFKFVEGDPFTPKYDISWAMSLQNPSPAVRNLLDGAAKLSSLSNFAELPFENKIRVLMAYLHLNVRPSAAATLAELSGLNDFNEIVCAGVGVCRHLTILLGAIINETGFSAKVVVFRPQKGAPHAWLEVDGHLLDGRPAAYVADPLRGDYFERYSEVLTYARRHSDSIEAMCYTKPSREYSSLSH